MDDGSLCLFRDIKKIRDSLDKRVNTKFSVPKMPTKLEESPQAETSDENCSKKDTFDAESTETYDLDHDSSSSESSIELARDISFQPENIPLPHTDTDKQWRGCYNSTLNEELYSAPISKFKDPEMNLISPIAGCSEYPKLTSPIIERNINSKLELNEKFKGCTPPHVFHKLSELRKLTKINEQKEDELDIEWIPKPKSYCNDGCDPSWLEPEDALSLKAPLKCLPPRTYTPARKKMAPQRLSLPMQSHKRLIRSSSPNTVCLTKAKRMLMDAIDLSSISNVHSEEDSSVELVPRQDTPGTVNSDEIAAVDLSDLVSDLDSQQSSEIKSPIQKSSNLQIRRDPISLLPSPAGDPPRIVKVGRKLRHLYYQKDILES
uniref:Uncharacterized protein LOC100184791 n=1 Tax=Phallusia mammillata TaxID=59560 RepID=A0A6F9DJ10_9ASCI|nr:uncharacterized protein LOC100184791 [Phallusia mammillata]